MSPIINFLYKNWKFFFLLITPIVLLPVFLIETVEDDPNPLKFRCAYVVLLMGLFWMSEAMPLAITALIPVVLFPLFNIQSTGAVCANYMRESVMMFIGGISLALAIEYSGLHKRIALRIMLIVGTSPWRLLLGLMITTMFLSCWIIINTAVAAMMLPIVTGLIESFDDADETKKKKMTKLFMLAIGYSANIGGTAVIIGSNPNLIARELLTAENIGQDGNYTDLNFTSWTAFNLPIASINLCITWLYLGFIYLGAPELTWLTQKRPNRQTQTLATENCDTDAEDAKEKSSSNINRVIRLKLNELGRITFHELAVVTLFAIVILLWFTRDPQIFPGWSSLFGKTHVKISDSSVALAIVVIMFIIPKNFKMSSNEGQDGLGQQQSRDFEPLLNWKFIQTHFPWNVILLVGGGFAISDGANKSGLSNWVGQHLSEGFDTLPNPVILLIFLIVISCLTEVISNAACANLILPILIALSKKLEIHPLYLSLPGVIACQFAFMLPVSNPPNAVVFAAGKLKILDMVKAGAFLNFACLTILFLMNISWGQLIFNYSNYTYVESSTLSQKV